MAATGNLLDKEKGADTYHFKEVEWTENGIWLNVKIKERF